MFLTLEEQKALKKALLKKSKLVAKGRLKDD